jgi:hypothetical protein
MANIMHIIHPYKHQGTWVFDDDRHGLVREPFVLGAGEMIDAVVHRIGIERPERGFRLIFSAHEFPGHHVVLRRTGDEAGSGTWYEFADGSMKGWLCPALLHYFAEPPDRIYARAEPLAG